MDWQAPPHEHMHSGPERHADLETALDMAALLVQRFGRDYLPFFMALEREMAGLQAYERTLQRVRERV